MRQASRPETLEEALGAPPVWTGLTIGPPPGDDPAVWPRLAEGPGTAGNTVLSGTRDEAVAMVSARVDRAASLQPQVLQESVRLVYLRIGEWLHESIPYRAVRFWNYIPGIHASAGDGLTRYMTFNAGRFAAMEQLLGSPRGRDWQVATATGVGHDGPDLHVHCLATHQGGLSVENPRQVPAYRYSARHGPVPPCFARATVVARGPRHTILVGGTAAVRGEDSVYQGDLGNQLEETFVNLQSLVDESVRVAAGDCEARPSFRRLRAYVVRSPDAALVRRAITARFPTVESLEIVRADVCRPELLIEIEGVAELETVER